MPPLLPTTLLTLGATLLLHAAYSANEFSTSHPPLTSPPSPLFKHIFLPLDITLETLVAIFALCFGIVLNSEGLKSVVWREWASDIEKKKGMKGGGGFGETGGEGAIYGMLEKGKRRGFLDIRGLRQEFADWVREGGERDEREMEGEGKKRL